MKLSPLLIQRSFNSFALESESPQVKLVNDKEIPPELSCDNYIETFNSLVNVGRTVHPIRVSLKASTTSMFLRSVVLLAQ